MNYTLTEIKYPSTDGKNTICGQIYIPATGAPRGIVQLAHGMIDYVGRYEALANYLTGCGFIFAGNDHLGHGKTVSCPEDLGFFAEKDGVRHVLRDIHAMNKQLRAKFPGLPIYMMGHSMGSFLSRLYVEKYPHTVTGHIIHGTGGPMGILPLGKALVNLVCALRGKRYRSKFIANLAFMGYNSKFDKSEGKNAWLTRATERVAGRDTDPFTNYIFTVSAYRDLFTMLGECNSKKWFLSYPKSVRTLILSGDADPVGNYGKGPLYVYKHLLISGCSDVRVKIYEGARHELFNETNSAEVFTDILNWLANE